MVIVHNWDTEASGQHTEANIRAALASQHRYRISRNRYRSGQEFGGAMRPGVAHVFSGECVYTFGTLQVQLRAGTYAELPGGEFSFEATGSSEVDLLLIWLLPPDLRLITD